jgi:hypothetical protein
LMDNKAGPMTRGGSAIFRSRFHPPQIDDLGGKELRSLELFHELATVTGVAQRPPATLSGSLNKDPPAFAGRYLLLHCR